MAKPRKDPSTTTVKRLLTEKLAWVFVLLVAAGLFRALALIPSGGDFQPTFHAASRYVQQGAQETGTPFLSLAVWTDYRSFDLLLLCFFFLTAVLAAYALSLGERTSSPVLPRGLLLSIAGTLGLLGLGSYCVVHGSNFLDYEPFVAFFTPLTARHNAALLAGLCLAAALTGALASFLNVFLDWKGGRRDE